MNFEKIKKNYEKKVEQLLKHNENYYDKNNPVISDKDYDELKIEIIELEKKYDFLDHNNSPSKICAPPFGKAPPSDSAHSFNHPKSSSDSEPIR